MAENQIVELITDPNTCFLMGAGCSACAEKPLIRDLSATVMKKLDSASQKLFENLEGCNRAEPTVEDLLNQLLQIQQLISSRKMKCIEEWDTKKTEEAIAKTLEAIVEEISGDWISSDVHERFLRRLAGHAGRKVCSIFTLNYDTVLEATLESLRLPYTDGFRGAENAYFDSDLYDEEPKQPPIFRLYKLHGSINWFLDEDDHVRRRQSGDDAHGERQIIYPNVQKYYQTQYGIYEELLTRFRGRLRDNRPNNKLVVLGYSFSDEHITQAIKDAICETAVISLFMYFWVRRTIPNRKLLD